MSREKARKESLDALARFVGDAPPPSKSAPPALPKPAAPARPRAAPPPKTPAPPRDAHEGRQAKLAEMNALRARREAELFRASKSGWRGAKEDEFAGEMRRKVFNRYEPTVSEKISDVLGSPAEKAGRAKHRDRGKRQGGR